MNLLNLLNLVFQRFGSDGFHMFSGRSLGYVGWWFRPLELIELIIAHMVEVIYIYINTYM